MMMLGIKLSNTAASCRRLGIRNILKIGRVPLPREPHNRCIPSSSLSHLHLYQIAQFGGATDNSNHGTAIESYLSGIGIPDEHHADVLRLVKQSLVGSTTNDDDNAGDEMTKSTNILTVAKISETFSEMDLLDLSFSIQQQKSKKKKKKRQRQNRPKKEVVFEHPNYGGDADGATTTSETSTPTTSVLTWRFGESLLDLAKSFPGQGVLGNLDQMEGPCGGQMACSTCHCYLDEKTYKALPPPLEEELDMLDLAFEPKETSRLGCQVRLDNSLMAKLDVDHQIVVTLPSGVNNEWEA